jgi:soluble P-type ATPase
MIDVDIPGFGHLVLSDLVCDFNGTLARDGQLLEGPRALLPEVARQLRVRVVTGNTFASAPEQLRQCPCELTLLDAENQAAAKLALVESIGPQHVAAIGNGRNDRSMLQRAALGIAVVGDEGAAREAIEACDLVAPDIESALDLLLDPRRLLASLRS